MTSKHARVPALRFPEFRNAGPWEVKKLEEIAEYRRGSFPQPYGLPEWYDDENGMPFVQVVDVGDNMKLKPTTKRKISVAACKQSVFAKKGTVIITIQGSIGRVALTHYDAYIDRTLLLFQNFLEPIEKYFFCHILQNLFDVEKQKAPGGIIKTITKEVLSSFIVMFPSLAEQQKIADCLSSLDSLIDLHEQNHNALKQYKKGLMQRLFPAEGKTTPALRFPEFRNAGAWEVKLFKDLYLFKKTYALSRNMLGYDKGDIKNIHYGDIQMKFSSHFDIEKEQVPYIITLESLRKVDTDSFCQEGDIIFADASEDIHDIGKCIEIVNINNEKLLSRLHTILARLKNKNLAIGFSGHLFQSYSIRKQIQREAQGAKVSGISGSKLAQINIYIPPTKKEQQKIADCLSAIDARITAEAQKIAALKQHKAGLMQKLFPAHDDAQE